MKIIPNQNPHLQVAIRIQHYNDIGRPSKAVTERIPIVAWRINPPVEKLGIDCVAVPIATCAINPFRYSILDTSTGEVIAYPVGGIFPTVEAWEREMDQLAELRAHAQESGGTP